MPSKQNLMQKNKLNVQNQLMEKGIFGSLFYFPSLHEGEKCYYLSDIKIPD